MKRKNKVKFVAPPNPNSHMYFGSKTNDNRIIGDEYFSVDI